MNFPAFAVILMTLFIYRCKLVVGFNLVEPTNTTKSNANFTSLPPSSSTEKSLNTTEKNSNGTTGDLDDRINLNFNRAGAYGVGKYGGYSQSDSISHGVNVGIKRPGSYQNLFSNSASKSNSFSHGPGAPLTFANTASVNRPGYGGGGNAAAGLYGGVGKTYAHSQNQQIEIPLDNRGTVLLSNLKERDNSTLTTTATTSSSVPPSTSSSPKANKNATSVTPSSATTNKVGGKPSDALVFS